MINLKKVLQYNKLFIVLFILLGIYIYVTTVIIKYKSSLDININSIEGVIKDIKLNGDKLTLEIKAKETIIANYYIKSKEEQNKIKEILHYGDTILLKGTLTVPLNNTIPNNFNYKKYLYNKKIYYIFNVDSYKIIKNNKNLLHKLKDKLYKKIIDSDNNGFYLAFILGDKTLLSSDFYENFQINGVSHLLALSGRHINILLVIINIFLKKSKEINRIILTCTILTLYLFLTGVTSSLLRATLFYILKNINKYFNLNYSNMKLLFICAFIILSLNPFMIYDLGFIYSFSVCFGIFFYHDFIKGNYFIKLFKLSLITFLFSLPITATINYEINLSSIFINMIFILWISLVVYPISLIAFIIPILNPIFSILINITTFLNSIMNNLSIIINIPKTSIVIPILFYMVLLLRKKNLYYALIILILIPKFIKILDNNYYVYFFDVGQGDSAVLVSPYHQEVLMIDTGGKTTFTKEPWQKSSKNYNVSDGVVKFLKSVGITKINYLIITHGDEDHAKDAQNIIKKFKVKNIILNNGSINSLEKNLLNQNINITNRYHLKYFNVINLNNELYNNENDNSIVNYISFLSYKFLFMGDASKTVEDNILKKYNLKNVDVIKVGHHGSKTSTDKGFIKKIKPTYSIISVGRSNRYNHPHEEVLNILKNTNILRTDKDGTITFRLDKKGFDFNLCKP